MKDCTRTNAGELRRLRWWRLLPAYFDLVGDLAGLPGLVAFLGREGVPGRLLDAFALAVANVLVRRDPDHLTLEFSKADRGRRIYVDVGRNGYSATFAATYAIRARPGAPVSAPCTWDELERAQVTPQTFTLQTMAARIDAVGDLWSDIDQHPYSLQAPLEQLRRFS